MEGGEKKITILSFLSMFYSANGCMRSKALKDKINIGCPAEN